MSTRQMYHKYKANPTTVDGMRFDSKLESKWYQRLLLLQKCGEVVFFLRQVPFHLPGGVKYVCDFQVFYSDNTVSFIDVKGYETADFKAKKKMVESIYPVVIEVVKDVK